MESGVHGELAATFDALSVDELRRRGIIKWSHYDADVLPAWVAEMDFPLAAALRAALVEAIERGATGYAPEAPATGLPDACAAWLSRSFGLAIEPHQIGILPGTLHGLALAIETFSRPDSSVVIMTPSYPPFFEVVRQTGRPIVEVPMTLSEGRYFYDLAATEAALRDGAGTVIVCNPHNPLGRVFTREELGALAALVEAHGARVVADEVHAPLIYPGGTHVSYSTVSKAAARHSATLVSASKGWNIPGLKCAQIVLTNPADLELWGKLPFMQTHGASTLGIVANRAAYEHGEAWRREVVAYLDGNRALLADLLGELLPEVRYTVPQGTYLAWLDCRALGLDNPAEFFLREAKVALADGAAYGQPGQGCVRLNFATSRPILTAIVRRMAEAARR